MTYYEKLKRLCEAGTENDNLENFELAQIEPKSRVPKKSIVAQFEPKSLAPIDRKHWHNLKRNSQRVFEYTFISS
jgi:hypothetical protein